MTEHAQDIRFDYGNQAWIVNGIYERCGHPEEMACGCYGRIHAGEPAHVAQYQDYGMRICHECGKEQALTSTGVIGHHWRWAGNHGTLCIGINTTSAARL